MFMTVHCHVAAKANAERMAAATNAAAVAAVIAEAEVILAAEAVLATVLAHQRRGGHRMTRRKPRPTPTDLTDLEPGDFVTLVTDDEFTERVRFLGRKYENGTLYFHFIAWEHGRSYDWFIWRVGDRWTYGGTAHTVTLAADSWTPAPLG